MKQPNVQAYIFTYKRYENLMRNVRRLKSCGIDPIVVVDEIGARIPHDQVWEHEHRGKRGFWLTWQEMLSDCKNHKADIYLFMPDDFDEFNAFKMIESHNKHKDKPYAYNIVNDGRGACWTGIEPKKVSNRDIEVGYIDCGFFCNRKALQAIKFGIQKPHEKFMNKGMSSGVGSALSQAFLKAKVKMYCPVSSYAVHGNHESVMHPDERKDNPLKSI